MKKLAFLILSIFILSSCDKEVEPVEMLKNTDLEDASLYPWFRQPDTYLAKDFILERITEESFSPTHSFKISKQTLDVDSIAFIGQNITERLPFSKNLTLSVMIKCVDLNGSGASIAIRCDDKNQQAIQFVTTQNDKVITGTFDWKNYSISLGKVKPDAANIIVYLIFLPNTTGTIYFDDIHLVYE